MLLMQDPKLLLLDEPVAGMTDEETERTAELFLSLAGQPLAGGGRARHEVHPRADPRQPGEEGDGAARGQRARRGLARRRCRTTRRWSRSTLAADTACSARALLGSRRSNQYYGGSHILRDVSLEAPGRRGDGRARPQRRRQDDAAEEPDGRGAGALGHGSLFDGDDITRETPYERVRRGIGYVPQGREIFARLTVRREPGDGPRLPRPASTPLPPRAVRALPGAEADARTAAAATSPAASSSSSRSPGRSPPGRACSCSTSRPRASSRRSSRTSAA